MDFLLKKNHANRLLIGFAFKRPTKVNGVDFFIKKFNQRESMLIGYGGVEPINSPRLMEFMDFSLKFSLKGTAHRIALKVPTKVS